MFIRNKDKGCTSQRKETHEGEYKRLEESVDARKADHGSKWSALKGYAREGLAIIAETKENFWDNMDNAMEFFWTGKKPQLAKKPPRIWPKHSSTTPSFWNASSSKPAQQKSAKPAEQRSVSQPGRRQPGG